MNTKEQLKKLSEEIEEAESALVQKKALQQRLKESIKYKAFACWFSEDVQVRLFQEYGNPTESDSAVGFVGLYEDHLEAAKDLIESYSEYLDPSFLDGVSNKYIVQTKCLSDQKSQRFKVKYDSLRREFVIVEEKASVMKKKAT